MWPNTMFISAKIFKFQKTLMQGLKKIYIFFFSCSRKEETTLYLYLSNVIFYFDDRSPWRERYKHGQIIFIYCHTSRGVKCAHSEELKGNDKYAFQKSLKNTFPQNNRNLVTLITQKFVFLRRKWRIAY